MGKGARFIDSCCIIASLNDSRLEDYGNESKSIIKRANDGEFALVTNPLIVAEVLYTDKSEKGKILDESKRKIDDLFKYHFWYMAAIELKTGELARELYWKLSATNSLSQLPKPSDFIHLATAVKFGCAFFETKDNKLVDIGEIGEMVIRHPTMEQYEYSQNNGKLFDSK